MMAASEKIKQAQHAKFFISQQLCLNHSKEQEELLPVVASSRQKWKKKATTFIFPLEK
jgi:hypothetical protein